MTRIPQNLRERTICMLNASMMMNAIAVDIGCSTRAIWQRFQVTGLIQDQPLSGRPRVTTPGQCRYIRNTHPCNM